MPQIQKAVLPITFAVILITLPKMKQQKRTISVAEKTFYFAKQTYDKKQITENLATIESTVKLTV